MYEIVLALSVVLFGGVALYYARHPAASMFHPLTFYLMFHGLVFTVRPIFGYIYDFRSMYENFQFEPTQWDKITALLCTDLALVTFAYVSLAIGNKPLAMRGDWERADFRVNLRRAYWVLAIPIGMIGVYGLVNNLLGSVTIDISEVRQLDAKTGAGHLTGVNGYVLSLPLILIPLVAIIPYLYRFQWWSYLPFAGFTLMKLATGSRGQVFYSAVMIVLLHMLDNRRRWPSLKLVPVVLGAVLIFNAIGADRGLGIRHALGYTDSAGFRRTAIESKPLETMDLANQEFLELAVWAVPQRTGTYDYFVHNLQLFTEPIPRSMWPGKPIGPPILMYELYRYAVPLGATFSVAGTGWMSAGYVGVILWSALFAAMYAWGYRAYAGSSRGTVVSVAYATLLCTSPIMYRDGSLISIAKGLQFYIIPVGALALTAYYLAHTGANRFVRAQADLIRDARARRRRLAMEAGATASSQPAAPAGPEPGSPRARRLARAAGQV